MTDTSKLVGDIAAQLDPCLQNIDHLSKEMAKVDGDGTEVTWR